MTLRKPHSPYLYYAFVVFSSGLFVIPWLLSLMRDLNSITSTNHFNIARTSKILWTVVGTQLICVIYLIVQLGSVDLLQSVVSRYVLLTAVAASFFLFCYIFLLTIHIYKCVLNIYGAAIYAENIWQIIFLTFSIYLSLPYLQSKVNKLLTRRVAI